mgnify:CR=1 FL=1
MKKEFAKWMGLMLIICQLTIPAYAGTSFTDVPDAAPYAEAVSLMKEYGIFNGDANGNFNPNAGITRAEFAAVVCRRKRDIKKGRGYFQRCTEQSLGVRVC